MQLGSTPLAHNQLPLSALLLSSVDGPEDPAAHANMYNVAPAVGADGVITILAYAERGGCESLTISDSERVRL